MAGKEQKSTGKKNEAAESSTNKLPKQVSAEITISYKKIPQKSKQKKIHSRQIIPPVKEGNKVPDETPTPPIDIEKR